MRNMNEVDRIVEAIKGRKPSLKIAGKYSNTEVERFLKTAIKDNHFNVSYKLSRVSNTMLESVLVTFIYYDPLPKVETPKEETSKEIKPTVKPTTSYKGRDSFNEMDLTPIDQKYDINGSTLNTKFLDDINITKGNVCDIHSNNPSGIIKILQNNYTQTAANSEGVGTCRYYTYNLGGEQIVRFRHYLGMPYNDFYNELEAGKKKAEEVMKMLTGGVKMIPEIYMMLAFAYLQKEVEYNYPYMEEVRRRGDGLAIVENHMAYGALVNRKAVCEGFSWAFIHMMNSVGIKAIPIDGVKDGNQHEWVKVLLNDKWYNAEITLINKQKEYAVFRFFLVTDNTLRKNGYKFDDYRPKCTDNKYEDFTLLDDLMEKYRDEYIRKGASKKFLSLIYTLSD